MHAIRTIWTTENLMITMYQHSLICILNMRIILIIFYVIICGISEIAAITGATSSFTQKLSSLMPSQNLTHLSINEFSEIDNMNENYAIRARPTKNLNVQHHNHHYSYSDYYQQKKIKKKRIVPHHIEDHKHLHNLNGVNDNIVEWMKNKIKNPPKTRRRHEKRWDRSHHNYYQYQPLQVHHQQNYYGNNDNISAKLRAELEIQSSSRKYVSNETENLAINWPVKKEAIVEGDVVLGGLMMVHSREESLMCGSIMPQGGIQALEVMLYTLDRINEIGLLPNFTLGGLILDDCDRDTYGLEMAVDFIKGMSIIVPLYLSNQRNTTNFKQQWRL
ncbi:uncharacterized protein LOC116351799 [Contarinia nasturtii]|uniref:uncharacterized protein LOC116351799 n=1 Tax=Contarinia nasturtii TaxID=265458 RepID=UPI0012D41060|nr:uncharacterized protein LOC116351799 [Contarinia nasturtii]